MTMSMGTASRTRTATPMIDSIRLWQLVSPTLPVGAYSYSQGLEWVVHAGIVRDEASAREWLVGLLGRSIAVTDLPVLLRVHAAWQARNAAAVEHWGKELTALRETAELRFEDLSMGSALLQLLVSLKHDVPFRELPFAAAFAVACVEHGIGAAQACAGLAWSWCEAQVAAAVKLVPLGHTAGQRLLLALGAEIPAAVDAATRVTDDELGMSMPGLALASALHETQYTRLFRS
jgi:urease accessory protein